MLPLVHFCVQSQIYTLYITEINEQFFLFVLNCQLKSLSSILTLFFCTTSLQLIFIRNAPNSCRCYVLNWTIQMSFEPTGFHSTSWTIVESPYKSRDRLYMRVLALLERGLNFWHTEATGVRPLSAWRCKLDPRIHFSRATETFAQWYSSPRAKLTLVFACFLNRQFCNLSRYIHTVPLESQLASFLPPPLPFSLCDTQYSPICTQCASFTWLLCKCDNKKSLCFAHFANVSHVQRKCVLRLHLGFFAIFSQTKTFQMN